MSAKFEFKINQDAIDQFKQSVQDNIDEQAGKHPIPRDSSVEEIEAILTRQVVDSGFSVNTEGLKIKAQEIFDAFQSDEV